MRSLPAIFCVAALAGTPAEAQTTSFTVHGPAVLHAGSHSARLPGDATRVELGRRRAQWVLAVGLRPARLFARRPALAVEGGTVTDRQSGRGVVALLGARLLAKRVHSSWLPARLARSGGWMRGMPVTALWRMSSLDRRRARTWQRRALSATLRLRGDEASDTHDVGLLYEGAARGYELACRGRSAAPLSRRRCRALHASARRAADRMALMIRANAPASLLPTHLARCPDCPAGARETIVDSMINAGLLAWAERRAGRDGYARLAIDHARAVANTLIRADGCTSQAVFTETATGRAFGVHTHQGIAATSTWARGQAWALLGYARLARDARDPASIATARRLAGCWLAKAPRSGVVRFDLDAAAGPPDSSAHAVAAAGLATLARADHPHARRWRRAARSQLAPVVGLVSTAPPLGRLGAQTYVWGGDSSDENTELPIAQLYVLDALEQLRR